MQALFKDYICMIPYTPLIHPWYLCAQLHYSGVSGDNFYLLNCL